MVRAHLAPLAPLAPLALGALLLGGAACSLLTDLNGLSGSPAPASGEGGTVPDGAAGFDDGGAGTKDGAGSDGSTAQDGNVSTTGFCAGSTHAFCADFDEGDPLAAWTQKDIDVGTTAAVSTTRSKSASHSLFSMTPQRAASTPNVLALLDKRFFAAWRRIVVELDIYEEQPAWSSGDVNAALVSVELQSSTLNKAWYLTTGPTYTNLNDVSRPTMPMDQWVHVKIDLDPAGSISATVGTAAYAATFAAVTGGANASMLVRVGIDGFNSPVPKFAVYYDNVTVDLP
ncbi:MAG: hypothetical protein JWO86_5849 [Myxococcaceae bacterium]|nr:hypothetical protein [Myxococcaceae bacterium]MEA2748596.1 hypothetical protein [Myxococcales bacterium]